MDLHLRLLCSKFHSLLILAARSFYPMLGVHYSIFLIVNTKQMGPVCILLILSLVIFALGLIAMEPAFFIEFFIEIGAALFIGEEAT